MLPDADAAERARIIRDTATTSAAPSSDPVDFEFHARRSWTGPTGPGVAAIEEAAKGGHGAVLVTGHFGQWEAGRAWMKSAGINCAGVYRPLDDRTLNGLYLASLEFGGTRFRQGRARVRGIVAHLARAASSRS